MSDKPTFSTIRAFGDSLSDAGNVYSLTSLFPPTEPVSPPYYKENYGAAVFSNGPTWVQDLSLSLGLGTLEPSAQGGTDFAYGGAETGPTPQDASDSNQSIIGLQAQLGRFEALPGTPEPTDLFTLWIGGNDIFDILNKPALTPAEQATDLTDSVNNEITAVNRLAHDGARNLLVVDVPDLGKAPEVTLGLADNSGTPSAALDMLASQLSTDYNTQLNADLAGVAQTDSLDLHILDAFGIIDNAAANPATFGLTNVTDPVWSGNFTDASSGTLAATGTVAQDKYLFFDDFHPTETGHSVIAAAALAALSGPPACFAAGTRVLTTAGEIPVEALTEGDLACTQRGARLVPIAWLGRRRVDCRRHPKPCEVWPVRVAAHAFGADRPHRSLHLSPDHAVYVEGALIPIRALVNGATIAQQPLAEVTYFHLEIDGHDIVLAEGLPVESYLDTGNRSAFANSGGSATGPCPASRACATSGQ